MSINGTQNTVSKWSI